MGQNFWLGKNTVKNTMTKTKCFCLRVLIFDMGTVR